MIQRHEFINRKVGRYYYFSPDTALRCIIDGKNQLLSELPISVQERLKSALNRFDDEGNSISPDGKYEYMDDPKTGIRIIRAINNVQPTGANEARCECLRRCNISPDIVVEYIEDDCFSDMVGTDGKSYVYFDDRYGNRAAIQTDNMTGLTPYEIKQILHK